MRYRYYKSFSRIWKVFFQRLFKSLFPKTFQKSFFKFQRIFRSLLAVYWVKDLALSLKWLDSLLCGGFDPWPGQLPHAAGMGKKKKKKLVFSLIYLVDSSVSFIKEYCSKMNEISSLSHLHSINCYSP